MTYQLSPLSMVSLTGQETTNAGKDVEEGTTFALLVGMQAGATLWKRVESHKEDKNRANLWPSNYTIEYLSQRYRCDEATGHLPPMFILFYLFSFISLYRQH